METIQLRLWVATPILPDDLAEADPWPGCESCMIRDAQWAVASAADPEDNYLVCSRCMPGGVTRVVV